MSTSLSNNRIALLPKPPRPANAYELLERVCEAILEEPKRYRQDDWLSMVAPWMDELGPEEKGLYREGKPACGTAGCRAGWIVLIEANTRPELDNAEMVGEELDEIRADVHTAVPSRAKRLLGFWDDSLEEPSWGEIDEFQSDVNRLFTGEALEDENPQMVVEDEDGYTLPKQGTSEYAELGVNGLREFMTKWEERLKATKIEGKI